MHERKRKLGYRTQAHERDATKQLSLTTHSACAASTCEMTVFRSMEAALSCGNDIGSACLPLGAGLLAALAAAGPLLLGAGLRAGVTQESHASDVAHGNNTAIACICCCALGCIRVIVAPVTYMHAN